MNHQLYQFISAHEKDNHLDIDLLSRAEKCELFSCFINDNYLKEVIQEKIDDVLQDRFQSELDEHDARRNIDPINGEVSFR